MGGLSTVQSPRRTGGQMNYVLANLIQILIQVVSVLILIDVIGSWVLMLRVNLPGVVFDLLRVVQSITAVLLNPIRRIIPSVGGLDLSPIIALLLLQYLGGAIVNALMR
jgi:YggT family protein